MAIRLYAATILILSNQLFTSYAMEIAKEIVHSESSGLETSWQADWDVRLFSVSSAHRDTLIARIDRLKRSDPQYKDVLVTCFKSFDDCILLIGEKTVIDGLAALIKI